MRLLAIPGSRVLCLRRGGIGARICTVTSTVRDRRRVLAWQLGRSGPGGDARGVSMRTMSIWSRLPIARPPIRHAGGVESPSIVLDPGTVRGLVTEN